MCPPPKGGVIAASFMNGCIFSKFFLIFSQLNFIRLQTDSGGVSEFLAEFVSWTSMLFGIWIFIRMYYYSFCQIISLFVLYLSSSIYMFNSSDFSAMTLMLWFCFGDTQLCSGLTHGSGLRDQFWRVWSTIWDARNWIGVGNIQGNQFTTTLL